MTNFYILLMKQNAEYFDNLLHKKYTINLQNNEIHQN